MSTTDVTLAGSEESVTVLVSLTSYPSVTGQVSFSVKLVNLEETTQFEGFNATTIDSDDSQIQEIEDDSAAVEPPADT